MKKTYDNYMTKMNAFMKKAMAGRYPAIPLAFACLIMHLVNKNYWQPVTYTDVELAILSGMRKGSLAYARKFLIQEGFMEVAYEKNRCRYTLLNCAQNDLVNSYSTISQNLVKPAEEWRPDAVSQNAAAVINTCIPNTSLDDNSAAVAQSAASVVGKSTKKEFDQWLKDLSESQRRFMQAMLDKLTPKQLKTVKNKYANHGYKATHQYAYMLKIIKPMANAAPEEQKDLAPASHAQASKPRQKGQANNEVDPAEAAAKTARREAAVLEQARAIAAENGLPDPLTAINTNQIINIPDSDSLSLTAADDFTDSINAQAVIEFAPAASLKPDSNGLVYSSTQHRAEQAKLVYTASEAAQLAKSGKSLPIGATITTEPSKEEIAEGYRKFMDAKYEAQCNAPDDDDEPDVEACAEPVTEACAEPVTEFDDDINYTKFDGEFTPINVILKKNAAHIKRRADNNTIDVQDLNSTNAVTVVDTTEPAQVADDYEERFKRYQKACATAKKYGLPAPPPFDGVISAEDALKQYQDSRDEDLGTRNQDLETDDDAQLEEDKQRALSMCVAFNIPLNKADDIAEELRERRKRRREEEEAAAKAKAEKKSAEQARIDELVRKYVQAAQNITLPDEPTFDELHAMPFGKAYIAIFNYAKTISEALNLPKQTIKYKDIDMTGVKDPDLYATIATQQRELHAKYLAEGIFVQKVENCVLRALGRKTQYELFNLLNKNPMEVAREKAKAKIEARIKATRPKTLEEMRQQLKYRTSNRFTYRRNDNPKEYCVIEGDKAIRHVPDSNSPDGELVIICTANEVWSHLDIYAYDKYTLEKVEPLN